MVPKTALNGNFCKPDGFFTQISNQILRDNSLSLKAKGLYSLIYSYITLPNFTLYKNYLQSQCSEGRCSFDSAWKELVAAGYLKHDRSRQADGTFSYTYRLDFSESASDSPAENVSEIYSNDSQQEHIEHTEHNEHNEHIINICEEPYAKKISTPLPARKNVKNKVINIPSPKKPITENQTPVSYIYNNTIHKNTKSVSEYDNDLLENLKKQIDYNYFMEDSSYSDNTKLIVSILLDYLAELTISGNSYITSLLETVDSCVINEFIEHIAIKQPKNIKFPLPYWKKAFINYLKESVLNIAAM